jgi:hypothetical protein
MLSDPSITTVCYYSFLKSYVTTFHVVRVSVHHSTIHKEKSNKIQQFIKTLG